ncbi:MAG TPA: rhomboid family intramembrane serine protease, partial [Labilithrix sp.]
MDRVEPPKEPTLIERLRASPVTVALFAINAVVFLIAESKGSTTENATLIRFGAVEPLHVWSGEYWRLGSYMFLHIGWIHLLWNTAMGFSMCTVLERVIGRWRFLALYLVSGIAGGAATTLVTAPVISAGASGALFGIIGALLALRRRRLPSWSAATRDPMMRSTLFQLALFVGITMIPQFGLHLNHRAHFGGM